MKTQILLICGLFCGSLSAQQDLKNIVKTNVTAYAFRNINLSYERAIKKWLSVNVGFGTMPEGNVPFLDKFLTEDDEFSDIQVGLTNFTIEPRFYLGEGYGKGFYFAPYYRHSSFKASNFIYTYEYEDNGGNFHEIPLNVTGKATGNSVGLMIGTQFFLGKKDNWVLDLWIVGAHYGGGKGDFDGKSNRALSADEQAAIKKDIEELDLPVVEYTVETNSNGAKIKLDGPWAGLRSGLSFGYRF